MIAFVAALSLLLFLGTWQLKRGLDKSRIEARLATQSNQYTWVSQKPETWEVLEHTLVEIQGSLVEDKIFLLANRVHRGQVGHEVLQPFRLGDGSYLMVNRGWTNQSTEVEGLSSEINTDSIKLRGDYYIPQPGFTLGEANSDELWPRVIQYFELSNLALASGYELEPGMVVLEENGPISLTRIWKPTVVDSSRHFGYAFQWWGLAVTLMVFGFIWRKQRNT